MNDATIRTLESLSKLRLPELQARFAEIVGEPTRSPNKTFLVRKIGEALETREQQANAEPTTPATTTTEASPNVKLTKLSVGELQAMYREVVGRETRSSDSAYVELGDMWSWAPARRVLPRRAREATPHNRAAFSGGMTLRFPRPEACMATGAASWRSQGERA